MQVERDYRVSLLTLYDSGARVRNAYATYLYQGDSLSKERLIPHNNVVRHLMIFKAAAVWDGHAVD